jgi:Holliday junction resolvase
MDARTEQLERERLLELAKEYRQKGYEVLLSPKPEELPDFLRGYRPDMIVRRGEEKVVIEVKSRPSIASAQYLRGLAQAVEEHPVGELNW